MYCTKCGNRLPEGVTFCPQCGNRVEDARTPMPEPASHREAPPRPPAVRPESAEVTAAVPTASAQPRKRSHLAISIVAALAAVAFVAAMAVVVIVALDDLVGFDLPGGGTTSEDITTDEDETSVDLVLIECPSGTTNIYMRFDCTQVYYVGGWYFSATLEAGGAIFWDFDGYESWLVYKESSAYILGDEEEEAFQKAMDGETVDGVEFTTFDEFIEEHPELT